MKGLKTSMIIILISLVLSALAGFAFLQHPKFGKNPTGKRLERIIKSPNYQNNAFQNLHPTPMLAEDASYFKVMKEFLFGEKKHKTPSQKLPGIKINLHQLDANQNILVWFGHSSYYMQLDGKKFLVDPVFSGAASPFSFMVNAFNGTDLYTVEDFPSIDYLIITHDHWDHLDYETILKLKSKTSKVICALGVGEHLAYWGYDETLITELDWNESASLEMGFAITALPARHFSGRSLVRNKSIWNSFALQTPTQKIYLGGDSGYDTHFAEIGKTHGPFDLAILENGQYDQSWRYIHMLPDQVLVAAKELKAKRLFPVHNSKFALANHNWNEPLIAISALNNHSQIPLVTPIIGEPVYLEDTTQTFSKWWEGIN